MGEHQSKPPGRHVGTLKPEELAKYRMASNVLEGQRGRLERARAELAEAHYMVACLDAELSRYWKKLLVQHGLAEEEVFRVDGEGRIFEA